MERWIHFDLDGTLADLYSVEGWLDMLESYDPTPYAEAAVMLNMSQLARRLHQLQELGWKIGIISWLSKISTAEYDEAVTEAKLGWLHRHLKSVQFDSIQIVAYGTPKQSLGNGILFDDEEKNRTAWNGDAYEPSQIMEILSSLRA